MNPRLVPTGQETKTAFEQVQVEGLVPIQQIFVQSLPAEVTFNCLESPMLLTHICRHWRTLAWDFSLLWRSLKLQPSNLNFWLHGSSDAKGPMSTSNFSFIKRLLSRNAKPLGLPSPTTPILNPSQGLWPTFPPTTSAPSHSITFPSNLFAPSPVTPYHRWKALLCRCTTRSLSSGLVRSLSRHSNIVRCCDEWLSVAVVYITLSTAISIPWDQLTHFSFYEEPWGDVFWERVSRMAALEHAHFALGDDTVGGSRIHQFELQPNRRNNIVLRTLSSLSISFWGAEFPTILLPDFWRYFDFPNLQALRLVGEDTDLDSLTAPAEPGSQPIKSIFLNKLGSMKHVTKLSLRFTWLRQTDCALLFDFLPRLIHLGLEGFDRQYYSGIFAALEMGVGRLSSLKTIVFESGNEEQTSKANGIIDVNALYSMVLSRRTCEPENRLERVVLYGSRDWQVTEFQSINKVLKDFVEGGLVVENRHRGDIQMEWWIYSLARWRERP
ncbi:hypothetical protein BKA70DRAFT_1342237 [Coprinopsis sp. MPI-PUGE-AT-0042]|nr:hypothetical protein BKA70DRAFT_1342237 [Coprinopsis sp. MPI-PUGE-AT-0042]